MAKRITELTSATSLAETDVLPIVDVSDTTQATSGTTKKSALSLIADYLKTRVETLTNKTLTSPVLDTGVSGTAVLDEDNMASNSATKLATQQSIKAYTDSGTQTMTNKTLTNPTITFSDKAPDYNVLVRASLSGSDQTVSNSTETKVTLNYERYDLGNDFDSTTNYRFTAPVAGYYFITAQVMWASAVADQDYRIYIRKDGNSDIAVHISRPSTNGIYTQMASTIWYFAANEYVELWCRQTSGGDDTIYQFEPFTFMNVMLVST